MGSSLTIPVFRGYVAQPFASSVLVKYAPSSLVPCFSLLLMFDHFQHAKHRVKNWWGMTTTEYHISVRTLIIFLNQLNIVFLGTDFTWGSGLADLVFVMADQLARFQWPTFKFDILCTWTCTSYPQPPVKNLKSLCTWRGRGQNDTVWIIWGASTYPCAKHVANLGGSGAMLPWEILILDLL